MDFLVKRRWLTANSTVSEVSLVNGTGILCYGLEPVTLPADSMVKPRAIPPATYDIKWEWSPKHQIFLPVVQNVQGFTAVEWHIGNWGIPHLRNGEQRPADTEACLLLGESYDHATCPDFIGHSTEAFQAVAIGLVHPALQREEPVRATYLVDLAVWSR